MFVVYEPLKHWVCSLQAWVDPAGSLEGSKMLLVRRQCFYIEGQCMMLCWACEHDKSNAPKRYRLMLLASTPHNLHVQAGGAVFVVFSLLCSRVSGRSEEYILSHY